MSRVISSGPRLRIASRDFEFIDVDAREDIVLHDLLADENCVLEVVTVPRHERDEHIASESEIALIGARTIRDDLPFLDRVALLHQNLLVDAGGGIRAHELAHRYIQTPLAGSCLSFFLLSGSLPFSVMMI
jgi:hypothetical protein